MKPFLSLFILTLIFTLMSLPAHAQAAEEISLILNPDKIIKPIDNLLYGHFLEHIYHSANGGLWGEVVWNRSFEEGPPAPARGRGAAPAPAPAPAAGAASSPIRHWLIVSGTTVSMDSENPFNSSKSAKIVTTAANQGISQANFWLRKNDALRGSIFIRGDAPDGLSILLLDGRNVLASQDLPAPTAQWKEYPITLTPSQDSTTAGLILVSKGKANFNIDQLSLMPDSFRANDGFRTDLYDAVLGLHPASLRWPGGSYVGTNGGYRWKGGIGPQSQRVGKIGWDELDPSSFGTDEFITLCKKIKAEPIIVIYLGSRTPGADHAAQIKEAAEWVEYCNGPADSPMGKLRAANGHAEPYHVHYFEIDNEVWSMNADDYVKVVKDFVSAMKKIDPTIKTIACGSGGFASRFGDGDLAVIKDASDVVDFLSIHHYENATRFDTGPATAVAYWDKMAALIKDSKNPNFKLYMSEWNLQTTDWRGGLYAGALLNEFEKSPVVGMACPALFLRHDSAPAWDNAFINFNNHAWFPAPNYVIMKLFHDHFQPNQIELTSDKPSKLNAIATKSADGKTIVIKLVNPTDQPISLSVSPGAIGSTAKPTFQFVAPDNLMLKNSFDNPLAVKVQTVDHLLSNVNGGALSYLLSMPRWSVGVLELKSQ